MMGVGSRRLRRKHSPKGRRRRRPRPASEMPPGLEHKGLRYLVGRDWHVGRVVDPRRGDVGGVRKKPRVVALGEVKMGTQDALAKKPVAKVPLTGATRAAPPAGRGHDAATPPPSPRAPRQIFNDGPSDVQAPPSKGPSLLDTP